MKYFLLRSKSQIYQLKANDIKQLERMSSGKGETTDLNQLKLILNHYINHSKSAISIHKRFFSFKIKSAIIFLFD
jgi:hypothetical protein